MRRDVVACKSADLRKLAHLPRERMARTGVSTNGPSEPQVTTPCITESELAEHYDRFGLDLQPKPKKLILRRERWSNSAEQVTNASGRWAAV